MSLLASTGRLARRVALASALVPAAVAVVLAEPPPLPERLSGTGLHAADGSVAPANRPFAPQYPLWSDGATKARWVYLPAGTRIDVSEPDAWRFPPGTTFWKELAWSGRRIETRMIRVEADGVLRFATYRWTEDGGDAVLVGPDGVPGAFEVAPGTWHDIPGIEDCRACHGAPGSVLGFSPLQLSDDRDPLAPHAERPPPGAVTLRGLVAEDRFEPPRPELASHPPRIRTADPVERAALGYLSGNCGGCHSAQGGLDRLGFVLLHDPAAPADAPDPALLGLLATPGRYRVPGVPAASSRIVAPGAPELSALLHRIGSRSPISRMPPLGTRVVDEEAVALIRRWIEGLGDPARSAVETTASSRAAHAG